MLSRQALKRSAQNPFVHCTSPIFTLLNNACGLCDVFTSALLCADAFLLATNKTATQRLIFKTLFNFVSLIIIVISFMFSVLSVPFGPGLPLILHRALATGPVSASPPNALYRLKI